MYKQGRLPGRGEGQVRHLTEDYDCKCIQTKLEDELKNIHNIEIDYQWVKGHQDTNPIRDKEGRPFPLTKPAKININYDRRTGKYLDKPTKDRKPSNNPLIPTAAKVYFSSQDQINTVALDA